MSLLADALLLSAAIAAAIYCRMLAGRLKALGDSGRGLGGAIKALDQQVEAIRAALDEAKAQRSPTEIRIAKLCQRADQAAERLEILLAGLHDRPEPAGKVETRGLGLRPTSELRPEANGLAASRQSERLFFKSATPGNKDQT